MEERKLKEQKHYDSLARDWDKRAQRNGVQSLSDIEFVDVMQMSSYRNLYHMLLKKYVPGRRVLDYGCGHGMHTIPVAQLGAKEVVGIDISEESLSIAQKRSRSAHTDDITTFIQMDAENLKFPDNSFDIVFDGGSLSSLELERAFQEIKRVLKPDGLFIGIETLGHHPAANIRRWFHKRHKVRTEWATSHILKMKDFKLAQKYFKKKGLYYSHFFSLVALPFQNSRLGKVLMKLTEIVDKIFFSIFPFLRRYGFKIVFIFSNPNKPTPYLKIEKSR